MKVLVHGPQQWLITIHRIYCPCFFFIMVVVLIIMIGQIEYIWCSVGLLICFQRGSQHHADADPSRNILLLNQHSPCCMLYVGNFSYFHVIDWLIEQVDYFGQGPATKIRHRWPRFGCCTCTSLPSQPPKPFSCQPLPTWKFKARLTARLLTSCHTSPRISKSKLCW